MTVGELVIKIAADTSALRRDLAAARAEIAGFADSVDGTARKVDGAKKSWMSWGNALKIGLPLLAGGAILAMQLSGGFASLGVVIPIATGVLAGFLAPFTTLVAMVAGFLGPLSVLTGLLGLLGGGFLLAGKRALEGGGKLQGFANRVATTKSMFDHLVRELAGDFLPIFNKLLTDVQDAIGYFEKLAHMPLAQAFKSLSTTGVAAVQKFLEQVGHMVAKPIYLAFKFAFGGAGDSARSALGSLWGQVVKFFSNPQQGGPSITSMISAWFGRQNFSAIGMRWGMDLAGWFIKGITLGVQKLWGSGHLGKLLLAGAGGGAAIGLALGGPIGAAMGASIGVAAAIVLNHYWKPISQTTSTIVAKVKQWYAELNKNKAVSQMLHITWVDLKTTGKDIWSIVKNILKILDDVFIKTGAWKILLILAIAAVTLIAGGLRIVAGVLNTIIRWEKDIVAWLTNAHNYSVLWRGPINAVKGAVSTIAGWGSTIVGWLQEAWHYAERFANAVSSIHFPSLPSIPGGSLLDIIGKHTAGGGMLAPGQASVVGERGPEIFVPSGAGNIIPNHRSFTGGSRGGGDTYLIFPNVIGLDRNAARQLARDLQPHIGRQIVLSSR